MNIKAFTVLASLSIILAGCATKSKVKPYPEPEVKALKEESSGVVFSLPKTILKVTFTLSEYKKLTWEADAHGKPIKKNADDTLVSPKDSARVVLIDKPIKVEPIAIADHNMRFILNTSSLQGAFIDSDVTIALDANGFLSSINYAVIDKTQETVTELTSTAFNIAKIAAVAGEDAVEYVSIRNIEIPMIIDLAKLEDPELTTNSDGSFQLVVNISGKDYHPDNLNAPEIEILLNSQSDLLKLSSAKANEAITTEASGIPYRISAPVLMTVLVDGVQTQSSMINIAQAGGIGLLPLNSKFLSDSTQIIAFHENSGVLKSYQTKFSSQTEAIASLLNNTSSTALTGLTELQALELSQLEQQKKLIDAKAALVPEQKSDIQKQIDELKKEKELLDAQIEKIESEKKLEELKQ